MSALSKSSPRLYRDNGINILLRFLTQTLRENMDELHRSEMLKRQMLIIARDIHLA